MDESCLVIFLEVVELSAVPLMASGMVYDVSRLLFASDIILVIVWMRRGSKHGALYSLPAYTASSYPQLNTLRRLRTHPINYSFLILRALARL